MSKNRKTNPVFAPLALQRSAPNPLAQLVEAQQLLAAAQHAPAERVLRELMVDARLRPEANFLLAISALMSQRPEAALSHVQDAVAEQPADARYQFTLGRAFKACGNLANAEVAYRRALDIQPHGVEAMVSLGIVLKTRGDIDAAIALYERALALQPQMVSAHANLAHAMALRAERRVGEGFDDDLDSEALDTQGRAVTLDPKNPQLHRNYGVLLMRARRHREAIAAFNESLSLDASDVECCLRLGGSLAAIGDSRFACEAYETWLDRNPPNAPVMRALAGLLTQRGEVDVALGWSDKAMMLDPDANTLMVSGITLMQARRLNESLARCRQGIDLGGQRVDMYPGLLLGLNYLHETPEPIFAAHAEFARRLAPASTRPAWRPRPPRLRVGYVSADFMRHSVSYFIGALLERHDRDRFEVTCYHNNARSDSVTERFKSYGHQWVECDGLSDAALKRRIVADGIDILIDLSGHTSGSRIFTFAMGAAPLQIAYLGYPTLSGVPSMDFRISDMVIDPGDQPELPHDRPLALPRTMFCYRPDDESPLAEPPLLRCGHITFGSFNNIAKVTDHTLALWAAAMCAVPDSRLMLKSTAMAQASNRADIEGFMAARGIAASRLSLLPWQADKRGHLDLYNDVDIALDTFPYNGATTTCEALWMGVPVITRRGATHTSRVGASLLGAIGQSHWVADTDADFVRAVAALASDAPALSRWRAQSRSHLRASELFDESGFASAFEALLDRAWTLRGDMADAATANKQ